MGRLSQGGLIVILALFLLAGVPARAQRPLPPIVFTQTAVKGGGERLMLLLPGGALRPLAAEFYSASDPDVSFDGKHILFAGKRSRADQWQIYEMRADGTGIRQITREAMDCRNPAYQSQIYTIAIEHPWRQVTFAGMRGRSSSLYSVKLDGTGLRRLTYNPFNDAEPFQMPDGRILFAARQPGRVSLFGINLDGTDFALFSGPEGGAWKRMPCVTARRLAVFVEPARDGDFGGTLGAVSLRRNLHSYRRLTTPGEGRFCWPSPLPNGDILVSRRTGTNYGVFRMNPETRRIVPVYDDPERDDIQAKAVVARPEPDGRASVVDEAEPTGKFYCLSVYTTDLANPEWWKPGIAKRLRVVEGACAPDLKTRLLGEFDIDEDGSFQVQTPANTPVRMQVLDADGMALRSCAWIWVKNKEARGCIGCHEDGESTPENRYARAFLHPAPQLTLPPERRRAVQYGRDVEPVLRAKCDPCHHARRLNMAKLVTPGAARTSPLVWRIFGRNTSRLWDGVPDPGAIRPMPPPGSPQLTPEERRTIIEWIDLGGQP